jgi:hypothetical protein
MAKGGLYASGSLTGPESGLPCGIEARVDVDKTLRVRVGSPSE